MTEIQLYNTRTRTKEAFKPIDPQNVRMYVCGPTVYDRAHIGNARPVVVFDVLYRLLRHVYGADHVTYARNFTDVDDRIINRAVETKGADETLEAATRRITNETIAWYHEDMDALGALRPDVEPRCTEMIPQMVEMTQTLIDKGFAYAAEGHVLFEVAKYPEYGQLARRSLDDMVAGARVEVAPYKKNPMDFVLWKPSTDEQPGWPSPWGRGRPGWHIECSAMAGTLFGPIFDIHGGGIDLQFPHHENEVAQSCCANGTDLMANVWMHNGFLQVEGEKMAKSLGNFLTVVEMRTGLDSPNRGLVFPPMQGEEIRVALLSAHYRQPLDWTAKRAEESKKHLERWLSAAKPHYHMSTKSPDPRVLNAISDDLNTPLAFAIMHELANAALHGDRNAGESLMGTLEFFGFDDYVERSEALIKIEKGHLQERYPDVFDRIVDLIEERSSARASKNFVRADTIRDGLSAAGVVVKDTPQGAEWELSPNFDASRLEAL